MYAHIKKKDWFAVCCLYSDELKGFLTFSLLIKLPYVL